MKCPDWFLAALASDRWRRLGVQLSADDNEFPILMQELNDELGCEEEDRKGKAAILLLREQRECDNDECIDWNKQKWLNKQNVSKLIDRWIDWKNCWVLHSMKRLMNRMNCLIVFVSLSSGLNCLFIHEVYDLHHQVFSSSRKHSNNSFIHSFNSVRFDGLIQCSIDSIQCHWRTGFIQSMIHVRHARLINKCESHLECLCGRSAESGRGCENWLTRDRREMSEEARWFITVVMTAQSNDQSANESLQ